MSNDHLSIDSHGSTKYGSLAVLVFILVLPLVSCGGGQDGRGSDSSGNNYHPPVVILDRDTLSTSIPTMAVADLNQDGYDDFVGARSSGLYSGPAAELLVMINNKNGSLTDETATFIEGPIPKLFFTRGIHIGDFNGDDRADIFIDNTGKELATGPSTWLCEQNTLLLSQPNGKLKDVTATHLPARIDFSHGSSIADIDADGDLDIWVNNLGCGVTVNGYLLRNDGNGMFTDIAGVDHPNGILPDEFRGAFWSQFVDINSDGLGDLFYTYLARTRLLLNLGNGRFSVINDSSIPDGQGNVTTQGSQVADVNNDGLDDLVLFQTDPSYSPGFTLQILINSGNGGYSDETENLLPPQTANDGAGQPNLWLGDINGDKSVDIMVRLWGRQGEDEVSGFYINDGAGNFSELSNDMMPPIHPRFAPIDVNNDGKLDFIFPEWVDGGGIDPSLVLILAK